MSTVEGRIADALAARAHLETVEAEALRRHRAEVRTTADDDVVSLDRPDADDDALVVVLAHGRGVDGHRMRLVLAAAAAVLVLAAASLGITRVAMDAVPSDPSASGSGLEQFGVLRIPQQPADDVSGVVDAGDYLAGSERVLLKSAAVTYWIALDPDEQVCLVVLLDREQVAGSGCAPPERVATDGVQVGVGGGSPPVTAWLAPDDLDTSGWSGLGRVQLAANLWVDTATGEAAAEADVRAASADTFVVEPFIGHGEQDLPVLTGEGTYVVLVRCLSSAPTRVEVDGAPAPFPLCSDGWSFPSASVGALVDVGSAPVTVTVTAPDGAAWSAGVVRCGPASHQCPSVTNRLW